MKKLLTLSLAAATSAALAGFTPGNLIVTVIGDGVNIDAGAQQPVVLREYTTAGVQVGNDIPLSFNGVGDLQLTCTLGETSEGGLTLSEDGRYLLAQGIWSIPGTLGEAFVARRVLAKIDRQGNVTLSSPVEYSVVGGDSPRGSWSVDGNNIWVSNGSGGIDYVNFLDGTGSVVADDTYSGRGIGFDGTNLYLGSSNDVVFQSTSYGNSLFVLNGKPTSQVTPAIATAMNPSPRGIYFTDPNNLYLGHSSSAAGIVHYQKIAGVWTNIGNSSAATTGVNYLTKIGSYFYATKDGGSKILEVADTLNSASTIVNMPTGYVVRGINVVPPVSKSVSGTFDLQNFTNDAGQLIEIEIRTTGGTVVEKSSASVQANGTLSFPTTVANGTYNIVARGSHWLGQTVTATIGTSGATGVNFSLVNGDVDHDDVVSVFDYIRLSDAFDSDANAANWDPAADLDGDGVVSVFDYIILSDNFDAAGTWF